MAASAAQLSVVGAQHRSAGVRRKSAVRTAAPAEAVEVAVPAAVGMSAEVGMRAAERVRWGPGRKHRCPRCSRPLRPPVAVPSQSPARPDAFPRDSYPQRLLPFRLLSFRWPNPSAERHDSVYLQGQRRRGRSASRSHVTIVLPTARSRGRKVLIAGGAWTST